MEAPRGQPLRHDVESGNDEGHIQSDESPSHSNNEEKCCTCNEIEDQCYKGVTISFQDVSVNVGKGTRAKTILSHVSGIVQAGTLTAIMGPSGAGKTTLVDVVTKRKNTGKREGIVLYDGEKPKASFLRYKVAYLQQEDSLIPVIWKV